MTDGERTWVVTYSCGHAQDVTTFIGDFDYVSFHEGLARPCPVRSISDRCEGLVTVRSAVLMSDLVAEAEGGYDVSRIVPLEPGTVRRRFLGQ